MTRARPDLSFNRRFDAVLTSVESLLCVGLDPRLSQTPVRDLVDACRRVIDATAPYAAAFKPNSAFFEAGGADGFAALAEVMAHVPDDRLLILDAKRGDLGATAEAYAQAAFSVLGADAVTVNPYLGHDGVAPFVADPQRGAIVLCHTSNPGAADFQTLMVGARPLYLEVAHLAQTWNGLDNVGLVVGATFPDAVAAVRQAAPALPLLVPGVGAQGGDLAAAVAAGLDAAGRGLVISSSRAIFYSDNPAAAARQMRDAIEAARDGAA